MQIQLSHQIAKKMLRGHRGEPLIQFIARISMVGMALAVAVLILVLSVMNGFEKEFRERILALVPHVSLTLNQPKDAWQDELDILKATEGITHAYPFVSAQALALRGGEAEPISLQGLAKETLARQASQLGVKTEIAFNRLAQGEVLLGHRLATKLGLSQGDSFRVVFVSPDTSEGVGGALLSRGSTKNLVFQIAGLVNTGTELDTLLAVVRLEDLSQAKYKRDAIDGFQFQVDDIFNVRKAVYPALDELGLNGYLNDWRYQYGNLYTAIQMSRQLVIVLLAAIVAIAAFNIFVSLGMSVRHRQREIAILRGYGMQKKDVRLTFVLQGLYIFLPGFIVGAIVGVLLALAVPHFVELLQLAIGIEFLDPSVYPIDYLPSQVRISDVSIIFLVALVTSLLATLVPAIIASRLNPASILS